MKTLLAEKPSVAREIAALVGATDKQPGYMEGNGYFVTWAFGHLIQLAMPEEYGFTGFSAEALPHLPDTFRLVCRKKKEGNGWIDDPGVVKQLQIIDKLFSKSQSLVNCCDAGREGELIFRFIYTYLRCNKPFERLWISSLTDKAIRTGLANLKNGSEYDNLYFAARARSEADWLLGVNSSQALTVAAPNGVYSLGRVQTPTLAMICQRYLDHRQFTSVPYWEIEATLNKNGISITATTDYRYDHRQPVVDTINDINRRTPGLQVVAYEKKEVIQQPPLLFDLTALQKKANTRLNFSAEETLSLAQSLYEKKYITYPRTGSAYISQDLLPEVPLLIVSLATHHTLGEYASQLSGSRLTTFCVDDKKVTDHHALLITGELPKNLTDKEAKIFDLIAGRMLEAFSPSCTKLNTKAVFRLGTTDFTARESQLKIAGWRGVYNESETSEGEEEGPPKSNTPLPELTLHEYLPLRRACLLEKATKPKPIHTESSLLTSMENAGKELKDEEQRLAMKDSGIGTPATRAAIIETLVQRAYIRKERKSLLPTEKGLAVFDIIKERLIGNVQLTGQWENRLAQIERGEFGADAFQRDIIAFTRRNVDELLGSHLSESVSGRSEKAVSSLLCPVCNKPLLVYEKVAKCSDRECPFILFRTIAGKTLSDKQTQELLTKRKTGPVKGFKSKAGKPFEASLILDSTTHKVEFKFNTPRK